MTDLAMDRYRQLTDGISQYHAHPYHRTLGEPEPIWKAAGARLLDFGHPDQRNALPLLIVPSLINKHYILDLREDQSFVRFLAAHNIRPFVLAWEDFGTDARNVTIDTCIVERLEPALQKVRALTGRPPVLLGYCLGGLLSLALAARQPGSVSGQVFMATPWDFHAESTDLTTVAEQSLLMFEPMLQMFGALPIDAVQTLFYAIDHFQVIEKFLQFAKSDPTTPEATAFVALEDWLNDGLPLPAPVARTLLGSWFGANTPAKGQWSVSGRVVQPSEATAPALVLVPKNDRIVPPASAIALGKALPNAEVRTVDAGHIGMVSSRKSPASVWHPLLEWLHQLHAKAP